MEPIKGTVKGNRIIITCGILRTDDGAIKPQQVWDVLATQFHLPVQTDLMLAHRKSISVRQNGHDFRYSIWLLGYLSRPVVSYVILGDMMKTIVGNIMPEETRMAIIEDGVFRDFAVERNDETHIVNHIYKGTIQNILPAMQAAFINIGRRKMPLSILVIFSPCCDKGRNPANADFDWSERHGSSH